MQRDVIALERNAWSMFTELGRGTGGRVLDTPTRLVVETPVPQPPYNTVWRFGDEGDRSLDEQVRQLVDRIEARPVTLMWLLHPSAPAGLAAALGRCGLVCAEQIYGMSANLDDVPPPPERQAGVSVHEVTADHPDEWVHLVSWRYGLATDSSPYMRDMFVRALRGSTRLWIARVDGLAASKVGMHVDAEGVAGIYGVATTEHGRNRGLATLLTLTALDAARAAGVSRAVLHSTPMARSLYRRLGFDDVCTFEAWARPDTVHL